MFLTSARWQALILGASLTVIGCSSGSNDPSPASERIPVDVTTVDGSGNTSIINDDLRDWLAALPPGTLSDSEEAGILFMREEEKLARDVYLTLGEQWGMNVFANISASEQTHADAVLALIERYTLTDPAATNARGVFVDPTLQGLHDMLVARGSLSLIDALLVGAEIEEIDLIDLEQFMEQVVGNPDIVLVYENLMKGSRNHLRAFVRVLDNQNYPYQPQHLTLAQYEAIINSPVEGGGSL